MTTSSFEAGRPPADHPRRCTATSNRSGEQCWNWARKGATVCGIHGGSAPQVQAAARRRLIAESAAKELAALEYEPVEDPVAELADIAGRARALMRWFEAKIAGAKDGLEAESALSLYANAMDRTSRLLESCARLGIEDRRVQLAEGQGQLLVQVMHDVIDGVFGLLTAAGVDAELLRSLEQVDVPQLVRARLADVVDTREIEAND